MKPLQRYEIDEHGCDIPVSDGDWVKWEDIWKKLIVSGSDAEFASITASNGVVISGSLILNGVPFTVASGSSGTSGVDGSSGTSGTSGSSGS